MFFASPALAYYNPGSPTGFVNDFTGVLTAEQKAALESKLSGFEKEFFNEIEVAIIPSLQGDTVENFTNKLFQDWGIGKKDKDNGVLVLIAIEEKQIRIEPGYGLEGALTDAQSYWIINNEMKPNFREGKYYEGINAAVDKIMAATKGEYVPNASASTDNKKSNFDWEFAFYLGVAIFIWLASILARSKSWWGGGAVGGVIGVIIGIIKGFILWGVISLAVLIPFGLLLDFIVSKKYQTVKKAGARMPWYIGGFGGGGSGGGPGGGGGFGGFGGGSSGGGGASGGW